MAEYQVPYDAQLDMLTQLRDMKRKVENGEIQSLILLAYRADGHQHLWVTKMRSMVMGGLLCLLQSHVSDAFRLGEGD